MNRSIFLRAPVSLLPTGALFIGSPVAAQQGTESPARPEPVEGRAAGSWSNGKILSEALILRQAQDERRVEGLTTSVPLTLADAVQRAVENNPDLAIVRLGTEVEAARVG